MKTSMRKRPVLWFYLLAFIISWLGWVPQALQARGILRLDHPALTILFTLLGGAGPTIAAILLMAVLHGKAGPGELFKALGILKRSWVWYLAAFLLMPLIVALALSVGVLAGQPLPKFDLTLLGSLPLVFLGMLISNVWEEIGWRGFALPRLQERFPDLAIVFIMGLLWELWHLPLYLNPVNAMSGLSLGLAVLFSLALTVIYTWLYNHTRPSLFFVTIFHAMSNAVAAALLEKGVFVSSYPAVVGVTSLAAVVIIFVYGVRRFAR